LASLRTFDARFSKGERAMSTDLPQSRVPVTVLTGFLGSGKTTLLRKLLTDSSMAGTAVMINEFGEIGLDHDLVAEVHGDIVLMQSGCICCSIRSDLVRAFCDLWVRSQRREIPVFQRVVVETTGLADPAPILATLAKNGLVSRVFCSKLLVATADATQIAMQAAQHPEVAKQLAIADRIVLTKTDLLADLSAPLAALSRLAPGVPVVHAQNGAGCGDVLLAPADSDHMHFELLADAHEHAPHAAHAAHTSDTTSLSLEFANPISAAAWTLWMSDVTQAHGDKLLRIKAIAHVAGEPLPVVMQAVGHVTYPSYTLSRWPSDARASRLVLIARGLDVAALTAITEPLRQ
jgi:G3E family GTPase